MAALRCWVMGLAMAGAPVAALAQTAPQTAPNSTDAKPAPHAVEGVTVTAAAPDVVTTIDRKSYNLSKDLQSTTGSVGDVLRNLPSVEVDLQGKLSMRGDPNVTVLIDGKPAPQFQGQGRADALQQIGADQFERVEVITNPSADLAPEGSGVINLISKKNRGAGMTGSVYGTLASAGTRRVGLSAGYNTKALSVTASLAASDVQNKSLTTDARSATDPVTRAVSLTESDFHGRNRTRTETENLNLTYDATPKDQLSAKLQASQMLLEGRPFNYFTQTALDGTLLAYQDRQGARPITNDTSSLDGGWTHKFTGEGHALSVDLLRADLHYADNFLWRTFRVSPPIAAPYEQVRDHADEVHTELTLSYKRPLPGGASLKMGYEFKDHRDDYPYSDLRGFDPAALTPVPALDNHFLLPGRLHGVYATYERTVGDFTVQGGLRFEDANLDIRQLTSGERDGQHYDRLYPTLHLNWKLDAERKLTFGFSDRVNRPDSVALNPLLYVIDPQNVQQGNPSLKPSVTRALELGFEDKPKGGSAYTATGYYRQNQNEFTSVLLDIGGGVYKQTFENLGHSRTVGLDLGASGKLLPTLSYSLGVNLYWKEIGAAGALYPNSRSAVGAGGRANLDWQVRKDDLVQFNVIDAGPRLLIQGTTLPSWTVNLGWRHKVDDRITLTLTAQDLLWSSRYARRYETPQLIERFDNKQWSRVISLRLDYRFGGPGKTAREPGFEYENPNG